MKKPEPNVLITTLAPFNPALNLNCKTLSNFVSFKKMYDSERHTYFKSDFCSSRMWIPLMNCRPPTMNTVLELFSNVPALSKLMELNNGIYIFHGWGGGGFFC